MDKTLPASAKTRFLGEVAIQIASVSSACIRRSTRKVHVALWPLFAVKEDIKDATAHALLGALGLFQLAYNRVSDAMPGILSRAEAFGPRKAPGNVPRSTVSRVLGSNRLPRLLLRTFDVGRRQAPSALRLFREPGHGTDEHHPLPFAASGSSTKGPVSKIIDNMTVDQRTALEGLSPFGQVLFALSVSSDPEAKTTLNQLCHSPAA